MDDVVIQPSAVVEEGARIGAGTKVWHHAQVRAGAVIGEGCNIGKGAFVEHDTVIGDRCKVANNVNVFAGVTLEDEVFVGPSATFTNDLYPRAVSPEWVCTPTLVRRGASIGANVTVRCGITIGRFAMIAAGSVVTRDVADFELVLGNPARHHGWVDEAGHLVSRAEERPEGLGD